MLGRKAWDGRHYCQKCYGELEQSICTECNGSIRHPKGSHPEHCTRCEKSIPWKGKSCNRCSREIKKCGYIVNGDPYCANCSKYAKDPIPCSRGCGSVTHTAERRPSLGFNEPVCRKCLYDLRPFCHSCRQKRMIAGEVEGKPACKKCCARGTSLRGICSKCGREDDAPDTNRCLGCRSIGMTKALIEKTSNSLKQDWVKSFFIRYADSSLLTSRPMQVYTLVKRNADGFRLLDQHIGSVDHLNEVSVLRAFSSSDTDSDFRSVKTWLSATHGLDFKSDAAEWYRHANRVRALKGSIEDDWMLSTINEFEKHLHKKREQQISANQRGGVKRIMQPSTLLAALKFACWFMSHCNNSGATSVEGIEQSHVDAYSKSFPKRAHSISPFLRFLNRNGSRISHLEIGPQRRKRKSREIALNQEEKDHLLEKLLSAEGMVELRNSAITILCLFYPFKAQTILDLRKSSIEIDGDMIHIDFGSGSHTIDPPISTLLHRWLSNWKWHSRLKGSEANDFLFPGSVPGKSYAIGSYRIWLNSHGLKQTSLRATAVYGLIDAGLPNPRLLVDLFGMSPDTAIKYWIDSGADINSHLNAATILDYRDKGLLQ